MPWLTSLFASLLASIAGLILAGFTADACTRWYHVSSREGAAGYFVVFIALAGGIAGSILGLITARLVAAHYGGGFGKEFGAALGVVLVVAGLSAALCRLLADGPPRQDGQNPTLVPPPPPPSAAELAATVASKKEEEFLAIPADAPVQRWFPYLTHPQPQTERARQIVAGRKNLADELGRLIRGDDAELAGAALRCIEALPTPTADLIQPVREAGRDLAERMRQVNETTPEQDPSYLAAADVSIRFSGWMCAARALREKCGGNFVPELKPMLELSRVRPDSHEMRMSVCRVASFYLQEWARIAPLPTDPKPR
jgi:hypothetical protein